MKIYAFTDSHGSPNDLKTVHKNSKKADLILMGGDFTIFESEIEYNIAQLNKLPKKVLLIHGNHEDEITVRLLAETHENIKFIHQEIHEEGDFVFLGYGGGGFATNDPMFDNWIKLIDKEIKGKRIVLMLHGPPYGTKTDKMATGYVGNKSYTKFIKKYKPELVLCGHIHETFGKRDKIGNTHIINPGPEGEMIEL